MFPRPVECRCAHIRDYPGQVKRPRTPAVIAALACLTALSATAEAADPGRWNETGASRIPLQYYQGVTSDPADRPGAAGVAAVRLPGVVALEPSQVAHVVRRGRPGDAGLALLREARRARHRQGHVGRAVARRVARVDLCRRRPDRVRRRADRPGERGPRRAE